MDGGAWWAAVHGVAKSRTRLSDFPFTFHFHALEKEMATHSSVLAWRIPGMGEPGGLLSMRSHRVRHDWSDLAVAVAPLTSPTLKQYGISLFPAPCDFKLHIFRWLSPQWPFHFELPYVILKSPRGWALPFALFGFPAFSKRHAMGMELKKYLPKKKKKKYLPAFTTYRWCLNIFFT